MENPSVIEIGDNDSIIITKQGKVVGFVEVARSTKDRVEMVANPVTSYNSVYHEYNIFNSFSTTLATNVKRVEDIESADNFIKFMKSKVKV